MHPTSQPHISVCVCTYRRPELLAGLIRALEVQQANGHFTFEVIVADNDREQSAEMVVSQLAAATSIPVTYCVEPERNIALARNAAVARATGDFVAFIDDDEVPPVDWLYQLFQAQARHGVGGVLGPVLPRFCDTPPTWITKGKFFDRPRHKTGTDVKWWEARTGNVLLFNRIWDGDDPPFRPQFGDGGEDVDFFRRMSQRGFRFIWCDEAPVYEIVPAYRCTRRFLMRRALMRGSNFPKQSGHRMKNTLKSIVAVPCYTFALPVLALVGHHHFVAYLVKLLDHGSRLLALAGLPVLTRREI